MDWRQRTSDDATQRLYAFSRTTLRRPLGRPQALASSLVSELALSCSQHDVAAQVSSQTGGSISVFWFDLYERTKRDLTITIYFTRNLT